NPLLSKARPRNKQAQNYRNLWNPAHGRTSRIRKYYTRVRLATTLFALLQTGLQAALVSMFLESEIEQVCKLHQQGTSQCDPLLVVRIDVIRCVLRTDVLLRRRRIVSFVADAHRMRLAAMARPAGNLLLASRKNTCTGKLRIDLPHQQDHLARNILTRIQVPFLWLSAAMTIVTVNAQCVTELAHQRICTVHVGVGRQQ